MPRRRRPTIPLIVCALSVALIISCGSDEPEPAVATATPRPTNTPYPTYTPRPTYTVEPTSSPAPTRTRTPVPTATPPPAATPRPATTATPAPDVVQVLRIIDGDTITVRLGGRERTLRYIGIDCPEPPHPGRPVEWLADEATAANRALVAGQQVRLEADVSETDPSGRLLAYVWLGDTMVNEELVRLGMAASKAYPPDTKHQARLDTAQDVARAAGIGLWGAPPTPTITPTPAPPTGAILEITEHHGGDVPEIIKLCNRGDAPQDMTGWHLYSEVGQQTYDFPSGYMLDAGACVSVRSAADFCPEDQLFWTEKNMWNNRKCDIARLIDPSGREIHSLPHVVCTRVPPLPTPTRSN